MNNKPKPARLHSSSVFLFDFSVPGKQQAQADSLCAGLKIVKTLTKFLESVEKENQPDDSQQILQESKESEARFSKSEQKTDTGPSCQIKTEREPKVQLVNPFWAGANRPDHPLVSRSLTSENEMQGTKMPRWYRIMQNWIGRSRLRTPNTPISPRQSVLSISPYNQTKIYVTGK